MTIPRYVWIAFATVSAIFLVVGTVWWLRARSLQGLVVLEVSKTDIPTSPSTATSSTASNEASEVDKRPIFFVPEPEVLPGMNLVYTNVGNAPPTVLQEPTQATHPLPNQGSADTDSDGLSNDQEVQLGTDPNKADTDGDGLSDGDEVKRYRTDPLKTNTDGDKYSDAEEIKNGYNPLGTGRCLTTDCAF